MNELEWSNAGTVLERGKSKYPEKTLSQFHFCLGLSLLLTFYVTHFFPPFSFYYVMLFMLTSMQNASVISTKIQTYMAIEQEKICVEENRGLLEVFTQQKSTNLVSVTGSEYGHVTFQVTQRRRSDLFRLRQ
jgi:hypothetical protein